MRELPGGAVDLGQLTNTVVFRDLEALHVTSTAAPVRGVALISDIEEITAVGPDTVVVLTREVARGGWMVSAALRYAWERRACALIVPEQPHAGALVELARRLGVSLFASARAMTRLALDASQQLGIAQAGSITTLHALAEAVSESGDVQAALRLVSDALGGYPVSIESGGLTTLRDGGSGPAADPPEASENGVVRVENALLSTPPDADVIVAEVAAHTEARAEQVLAYVAPVLRGLVLDERLRSLRDSLPVVSVTALTGDPKPPAFDDAADRGVVAPWPLADGYVVLCISAEAPDRVASAVHHLWLQSFPHAPLARIEEGWLGYVHLPRPEDQSALLHAVRRTIDGARDLRLTVGVSRPHRGPESAPSAVREAWLAARLASPGGGAADAVVEFGRHSPHLLGRLLPREFAAQLFRALLPDLAADPAADALVAACAAYLTHQGSVSKAAKHLGVHRNTLQARLRRAEQLGADVTDPAATLSTLLLFSAHGGGT